VLRSHRQSETYPNPIPNTNPSWSETISFFFNSLLSFRLSIWTYNCPLIIVFTKRTLTINMRFTYIELEASGPPSVNSLLITMQYVLHVNTHIGVILTSGPIGRIGIASQNSTSSSNKHSMKDFSSSISIINNQQNSVYNFTSGLIHRIGWFPLLDIRRSSFCHRIANISRIWVSGSRVTSHVIATPTNQTHH